MKNKLLYSEYNEETGISTVTIQNQYGIFSATSKLHPEDKENASQFLGCEIAEYKAIRKSLIHALKETKKIQLILYDIMSNTPENNHHYISKLLESNAQKEINLNHLIEKYDKLICNLCNTPHSEYFKNERVKKQFQDRISQIFSKLIKEYDNI